MALAFFLSYQASCASHKSCMLGCDKADAASFWWVTRVTGTNPRISDVGYCIRIQINYEERKWGCIIVSVGLFQSSYEITCSVSHVSGVQDSCNTHHSRP